MITYYQVLDENYEVLGSFAYFDEALRHTFEGCILRYWDGSNFIYNVTSPRE